MEILHLLTTLINTIFIKGLFISILSIIIVGKAFKTDTRNAFTFIKWLIWIYAGLNISYYFITYFSAAEMDSIWERTTGPYSFFYYLMLMTNTIFPLFLLFKNLGRNKYILLVLSFLMNIGWMFELFVIYSTDLHREHIANQLSLNILWFIILKGVFVGSVIYAIGSAIKRKTPGTNTSIS